MWRIGNKYFNRMRENSSSIDGIVLSAIQELDNDKIIGKDIFGLTKMGIARRIGKPKLWSHIGKIGYEICGGKNNNNFLYIGAAYDLLMASYYGPDDIFDVIELKEENRPEIEDNVIMGHIFEGIATKLLFRGLKNMHIKKNAIFDIQQAWENYIKNVYEGYYLENHNSSISLQKIPSEEQIFKRIYAWNNWEHYLRISGLIAGANKDMLAHLTDFGKNAGMAYMITDDIIDLGKKREDMKCGRYTLPNVYAIQNTNESQKEIFSKGFGNRNATQEELLNAAKIVIHSGAIEHCQGYVIDLLNKAVFYMNIFPKSENKDMLKYGAFGVTYINKYYKNIENLFGYKTNNEQFRLIHKKLFNNHKNEK